MRAITTDGLDKFKELFRRQIQATKMNYFGESNRDFYIRVEKETRTIAMQCLSSKYVLHRILNENPTSMLITSGTLSPINTLNEQIGVYC
jgi:hypothetical protein